MVRFQSSTIDEEPRQKWPPASECELKWQLAMVDARTVMSHTGQLVETMQGFCGLAREQDQEGRPKGKLMVVE